MRAKPSAHRTGIIAGSTGGEKDRLLRRREERFAGCGRRGRPRGSPRNGQQGKALHLFKYNRPLHGRGSPAGDFVPLGSDTTPIFFFS